MGSAPTTHIHHSLLYLHGSNSNSIVQSVSSLPALCVAHLPFPAQPGLCLASPRLKLADYPSRCAAPPTSSIHPYIPCPWSPSYDFAATPSPILFNQPSNYIKTRRCAGPVGRLRGHSSQLRAPCTPPSLTELLLTVLQSIPLLLRRLVSSLYYLTSPSFVRSFVRWLVDTHAHFPWDCMSYMNHRDPSAPLRLGCPDLKMPGPALLPALSPLPTLLLLALSRACTRSRTSTTIPFFPQHHHHAPTSAPQRDCRTAPHCINPSHRFHNCRRVLPNHHHMGLMLLTRRLLLTFASRDMANITRLLVMT